MISYGPLASWYDRLTGDVEYERFADYYEAEFARDGGEFRLLLDLCCGTGTLTGIMHSRGYDMIAVDSSYDMLIQARSKYSDCNSAAPLFIYQDATELDLFGTVDAAYCSLDGINYIPPEQLDTVFSRLSLFIRPGGLFIFDIRPEVFFSDIDGSTFIDEDENVYCVWRADFDSESGTIVYGMDLFTRDGTLWKRDYEEHLEYSHSLENIKLLLNKNGFTFCNLKDDITADSDLRLFITAKRV